VSNHGGSWRTRVGGHRTGEMCQPLGREWFTSPRWPQGRLRRRFAMAQAPPLPPPLRRAMRPGRGDRGSAGPSARLPSHGTGTEQLSSAPALRLLFALVTGRFTFGRLDPAQGPARSRGGDELSPWIALMIGALTFRARGQPPRWRPALFDLGLNSARRHLDHHGRRCAATASAPTVSPTERRPATTPSTSAPGRFWLSLNFASMRSMCTSTPTIARS
jgi:hypothetical protein